MPLKYLENNYISTDRLLLASKGLMPAPYLLGCFEVFVNELPISATAMYPVLSNGLEKTSGGNRRKRLPIGDGSKLLPTTRYRSVETRWQTSEETTRYLSVNTCLRERTIIRFEEMPSVAPRYSWPNPAAYVGAGPRLFASKPSCWPQLTLEIERVGYLTSLHNQLR